MEAETGLKTQRSGKFMPLMLTAAGFIFLCMFSGAAADGAVRGLKVCAGVVVPSLFPFFVLSGVLNRLGLPEFFGRLAEPWARRLFGVSGAGATAFVIGLCGGYPLGAVNVAQLYSWGDVDREEAQRLLAFCNNSGPAFLIGAAGTGVFGSGGWGLLLYISHVLAAVTVGVIMRGKAGEGGRRERGSAVESLPAALSESVSTSVAGMVKVCGFVVFFAAVTGMLEASGAFAALYGAMAARFGLELHWCRSLLTGLLELGGGIGAMQGLSARPVNLALASFLIGWGGVSVHCQTMAALSGTGLSAARHTLGRLLCGIISAAYTFLASSVIF